MLCFFFFKQKTAYEMRISDWSSDVCSSDLLNRAMEAASERLDFEEAARLRDQVAMIRTLQARQYVEGQVADMDLLACAMQGTHACVLLLAFRDGRNLGTRAFFPKTNGSDSPAEVLAADRTRQRLNSSH